MSESEKLRKIFIGGLNWETTEDGLKEYFSKWGVIVDCVIMKKDGRSRGFGFVTYASSKSVDDCLKIRGHVLDDREIEPKRSIPKDEAKNPMALTKTRKIFVGGLASTTTDEDIRDYFTKLCEKDGLGQVIDVELKKDKDNPNRIRGFAFVTFDDEEIAEKVCAMKYHEIRMKQCEVKKAEPQSMLRKKHEEEFGRESSDRDRNRDRDSRDSRDRDRSRGDRDSRDRGGRDRERGREGEMSNYFPFGFNPAAFGPGGFGTGFGFGGMGFAPGFAPGFAYGGFPGGFGAMGGGFGGFGGRGNGGASGDRSGGFDKGSYSTTGGYTSSDRERSKSPSTAAVATSASGRVAGYDQSSTGAGSYAGYPFGAMSTSMASPADWSSFQAAAMMNAYGYTGDNSGVGQASSDTTSKTYPGTGAIETSTPLNSYNQMSSTFGPSRGAVPDVSKTNRGYRPY